MRQSPEVAADQSGKDVRALHVPSQLNVMPAFAVSHGGVGDPVKQVRTILHRAVELVRLQYPGFFLRSAPHLQIEPVELFPHFCAALFAHMTQVLASRSNARDN